MCACHDVVSRRVVASCYLAHDAPKPGCGKMRYEEAREATRHSVLGRGAGRGRVSPTLTTRAPLDRFLLSGLWSSLISPLLYSHARLAPVRTTSLVLEDPGSGRPFAASELAHWRSARDAAGWGFHCSRGRRRAQQPARSVPPTLLPPSSFLLVPSHPNIAPAQYWGSSRSRCRRTNLLLVAAGSHQADGSRGISSAVK